MEKWNAKEVLEYWLSIHGRNHPNWNSSWDDLFLNHPEMNTILSVDASWIREAIKEYKQLKSVSWQIKNKLDIENAKKDTSGLYSPVERNWW